MMLPYTKKQFGLVHKKITRDDDWGKDEKNDHDDGRGLTRVSTSIRFPTYVNDDVLPSTVN